MRSPLRMLLLLIALVVATYEYIEKPSKNTSSAVPPTQASTGCGGAKNCEQGRVTRVIDGDTLDIDGRRVRLVLVDAPERNARGGAASTAYLRTLCPEGSAAGLQQDAMQPTDEYGRTLGVVWCGNTRVNEAMIRSGHARLYKRFCDASEFGGEPWALQLGCIERRAP